MDARSALEALKIIHRRGVTTNGWWGGDVCCMACEGTGWPCQTREIIDKALAPEGSN